MRNQREPAKHLPVPFSILRACFIGDLPYQKPHRHVLLMAWTDDPQLYRKEAAACPFN